MMDDDKKEILNLKKLLADEREERKKVQQEMQELKRLVQINVEQPISIESQSVENTTRPPEAAVEQATVGTPSVPPEAPVQQPTGEQLGNTTESNNSTNNISSYYMPLNERTNTPIDRRQLNEHVYHRLVTMEQRWLASSNIINNIGSDVDKLWYRVEELERYSKLYNILIHGLQNVPEYKPEEATKFCKWVADQINALLPNLCTPVTADHIDHAHPLRTRKPDGNVVIVRFDNRAVRYVVYGAKKDLKRSTQPNVSFTEHLTAENLRLLHEAKDIVGRDNVWTDNCFVLAKVGSKTFRVRNNYSLNLLRKNALQKASQIKPKRAMNTIFCRYFLCHTIQCFFVLFVIS